jgi:hypothetical protein
MPESTASSVVEDITEVTWEDLAMEMADGEGPDVNIATSGGCGTTATCVTGFTSTGSCTA